MKVALYTQVRENYGTAKAPYWKFKGGSTFVVPNLTVAQTTKVKENGIPTLKALIETKNSGFEEYVVDWAILDDDAVVGEAWETPTELFWENNVWVARCTQKNDEYGYMRQEIAAKHEEYVMGMGGERINYQASFTMCNGETLSYAELDRRLNKAA